MFGDQQKKVWSICDSDDEPFFVFPCRSNHPIGCPTDVVIADVDLAK